MSALKTGFRADASPKNWFSCRHRSECRLHGTIFKNPACEQAEGPGLSAVQTPLVTPSRFDLKTLLEKTSEGVLEAARQGDLRLLAGLCDEGYSLLAIDEDGNTALHYGATFGHKEVVSFLLRKAPASLMDMADVEKGQTALHKAAASKMKAICCLLVTAGASIAVKVLLLYLQKTIY